MTRRSFLKDAELRIMIAVFCAVTIGAAPETRIAKEVPRLVMKNLRMEGQNAGKDAIGLPRKKFLPIDADLEAGTWGFTRTLSFQYTYVPKDGPPNTFPEQVITHPVVETDPRLTFCVSIYRGDKLTEENIIGTFPAFFGHEVKPWEAKVRYWVTTPDQPGEYTLDFIVCDQERATTGKAEAVKLAQ